MNISDFFHKFSLKLKSKSSENTGEYGYTDCRNERINKTDSSESNETEISIQFGQSDKITVYDEYSKYRANLIDSSDYVVISTAGDDRVCQMCKQFDHKIFPKNSAPKLPLCPLCSCAYLYYLKQDLPENSVISNINDFVLPSECVTVFFEHHQVILETKDDSKKMKLCEYDLGILSKLMTPYISAGFNSPEYIDCRDLYPELCLKYGLWDKAEKIVIKCIEAKAYYPADGSKELKYVRKYKKIAIEVSNYINENPGVLQRNIYKKFPFQGVDRDVLKHFLRYNRNLKKEKFGSTNKLYIKL